MKNLDGIVNQILAEAFAPHEAGPLNALKTGGDGTDPGKIQKQMLAGELIADPAFFVQTPVDDKHQGIVNLLGKQSKQGLGDLVGLGSAVNEFVEAYLEDTAVEMYTNPNNIEYLINSLQESGYTEYATAVDSITSNPTIDDVAKINKMVEVLSKDEKNAYFTESLTFIAEQIVDEAEAEGAGPTDEGDAPGDGEASKQKSDNTDGDQAPSAQSTKSDD
jgi:hypothetical protein